MPTISVIVPVYKVENYLHRCIDSILAQTFSDFELILVDDGSPDNSGKICDEYKEKDNRVIVIHKENGGLSSARNAGLDIACGEWITFIDSDDWIHPQYLERLYSACTENNVDIAICKYFDTPGKTPQIQINENNDRYISPEELWCECQVNATVAWGKLYKKSLWENICFPVGKIHEDEHTTYKLLFQCENIAYIEDKLYFYYINPNGIIGSGWSLKRLDAIPAFEKQINYFQKNKFYNAMELSVEYYLRKLFECYRQLEGDRKRQKKLRWKIRKFYFKNPKYLKAAKKKDDWKYYAYFAFPIEMRLKEYYKAVKRKVKKSK